MSLKILDIPTPTKNKAKSIRVSCRTVPSVLILKRVKSIKITLKLFTKDLNTIKLTKLNFSNSINLYYRFEKSTSVRSEM